MPHDGDKKKVQMPGVQFFESRHTEKMFKDKQRSVFRQFSDIAID